MDVAQGDGQPSASGGSVARRKSAFTLVEVKETDLLWETDWVSEVFIGLGSTTFEQRFEYYIYDLVKGTL